MSSEFFRNKPQETNPKPGELVVIYFDDKNKLCMSIAGKPKESRKLTDGEVRKIKLNDIEHNFKIENNTAWIKNPNDDQWKRLRSSGGVSYVDFI